MTLLVKTSGTFTHGDSHLYIPRRDGGVNDEYGHEKYTENKRNEVDYTVPYYVEECSDFLD